MNMEETKESSESPSPPTSFSSLPYEIVDNCLARISLNDRPFVSLVSKSLRSLVASPELDATRSRMGITEDCLYVCLNMKNKYNNPNPRWFVLAPKRQKLLPIPNPDMFPYLHPESSTIVSIGSEMYLIGGLVNENRSRRMLFLDCRSHQWGSLPDMIVPRDRPAAEVIDGKIYVIGGCSNIENWGEVYDPKTQTWEPFSPTTLDLTTQMSVVPGKLVMGGKIYEMNGWNLYLNPYIMNGLNPYIMNGWNPNLNPNICLAEIETNVWCEMCISNGQLHWRVANANLMTWSSVEGVEKLSSCFYLVSVANSGGRRVTVWWKSRVDHRRKLRKCKREIWCAEISFQRQGVGELRGCIEWFKPVYTFSGLDFPSEFVLNSALVTH